MDGGIFVPIMDGSLWEIAITPGFFWKMTQTSHYYWKLYPGTCLSILLGKMLVASWNSHFSETIGNKLRIILKIAGGMSVILKIDDV